MNKNVTNNEFVDNITKIRIFNYIKYLMTSNCQKIILAAILKTDFNRF